MASIVTKTINIINVNDVSITCVKDKKDCATIRFDIQGGFWDFTSIGRYNIFGLFLYLSICFVILIKQNKHFEGVPGEICKR